MKAAVAAMVLALAACTSATPRATPSTGSPTPTETTPASTAPPGTPVDATVYYLISFGGRTYLAPERHPLLQTEPGIEQLLEIVQHSPVDPDLTSALPEDTEVRGVAIAGGVATVDWGANVLDLDLDETEATMAVQQVVWTLRELDGVDAVRFTVEGRTTGTASNGERIQPLWGHFRINDPSAFHQMDDVLEPITVSHPMDGETVGETLVMDGTASVLEANVVIRLLDTKGHVQRELHTTAREGAPGRGPWRKRIVFPEPGRYILQAVEVSEEDGSDFFVESKAVTADF